MQQGLWGKVARKFLSFAHAELLETCFYGQDTSKKKEPVEENYITTFNFLNLVLIANVEKIILKTDFLKLKLRLSIFAVYRT